MDDLFVNDKQVKLPWTEKYRPGTLDDVVSHDENKETLKTFIAKRCMPHLLFYGPPGSGKTSAIMAIARELYGPYYDCMVMELNASDDRGIEVVRTRIKQFVSSSNVFFENKDQNRTNMFKLVILDEIDAMTTDAQAILRKIVEQYTNTTRFCLICNYIQNISVALQSRSTKFRFSPILVNDMKNKLSEIAKIEEITITPNGLTTIVKRSNGDMRKAINILQSVYMTHVKVNEKNINTCMGHPRIKHMRYILSSLTHDSFSDCYTNIGNIKKENGISLCDILSELCSIIVEYITTNKTVFFDVMGLTNVQLLYVLDKMRKIESNALANTTDNIQMSGLISIFKSLPDSTKLSLINPSPLEFLKHS